MTDRKRLRYSTTEVAQMFDATAREVRALDPLLPVRRDWAGRRIFTEADFPKMRELLGLPPEQKDGGHV